MGVTAGLTNTIVDITYDTLTLKAIAAAGNVLGVTPEQLAHRLGIASSRRRGMTANIGTMTKSTNRGRAAMHGPESAPPASNGFIGNSDPFETHNGHGAARFGGTSEAKELLKECMP